MAPQIHSEMMVRISEFKTNPMNVVERAKGLPFAVINGEKAVFYCVPAKTFEAMMDYIEDMELRGYAQDREAEESVPVSLDNI
ncbi:antitoxin [Endozoicomonas arenosclerae]|uniref:antitoxin n=1 Tax=Endozoicomonas arenosclerae TaxID=1633495 RepID=UPI000780A749|nr:antitoxin [Endozoicomonas arenosclerae]